MRKVAEAVGKDVKWDQQTMTANIVEKLKIKEGDLLTDDKEVSDFKIISYDNDGSISVVELDGIECYAVRYILSLMSEEYKDITWEVSMPLNITIYKTLENGNKKILIDSVQYKSHDDRAFISKEYYENTILPVVQE